MTPSAPGPGGRRSPVDAAAPLDVAVLLSESAARLTHRLGEADRSDAYDLVGAVASHPDGEAVARTTEDGVPTETVDIEAFYGARDAPLEDMTVREAYDRRIADALTRYDPDLVVCSGYRFVLTAPVLDRFAPALVGAHHADLTLRTDDDEPLYPGLRAVRDALSDGRTSTRETVHVVTEGDDVVRKHPLLFGPATPRSSTRSTSPTRSGPTSRRCGTTSRNSRPGWRSSRPTPATTSASTGSPTSWRTSGAVATTSGAATPPTWLATTEGGDADGCRCALGRSGLPWGVAPFDEPSGPARPVDGRRTRLPGRGRRTRLSGQN